MTQLQQELRAFKAKLKNPPEKQLRKVALDQCAGHGHTMAPLKEYQSRPGKWTSFCETCGSFLIVYDDPPERGDQIAGKALTEPCQPNLNTVLGHAEP